jgi:hypothetical protein
MTVTLTIHHGISPSGVNYYSGHREEESEDKKRYASSFTPWYQLQSTLVKNHPEYSGASISRTLKINGEPVSR